MGVTGGFVKTSEIIVTYKQNICKFSYPQFSLTLAKAFARLYAGRLITISRKKICRII